MSAALARTWRGKRRADGKGAILNPYKAPPGAIAEIAALVYTINTAADDAAATVHAAPAQEVEFGIASDDAEARSLGWPAASSHGIALAIAAAELIQRGITVTIVPRGSTTPTAAASDILDDLD